MLREQVILFTTTFL